MLSLISKATAGSLGIGSGYPGLKIAIKQTDPGAIVIYQDTPPTAGGVRPGRIPGYSIDVLYDNGYHLTSASMWSDIYAPIPQQLYPFGTNSAFTSSGGSWDLTSGKWQYASRTYTGYGLKDGKLTIFTNVQDAARIRYRLDDDDVFLGCVGDNVFFWKRYVPSKVFWINGNTRKEFYYGLSRKVIDIFGVTKGLGKDVDIRVFRKASGLIQITPYEPGFIEISFSSGRLVRAKK